MSDMIVGRVVFGPATSDTSVDWPLPHGAGTTLVMVRQDALDALHARIAELEEQIANPPTLKGADEATVDLWFRVTRANKALSKLEAEGIWLRGDDDATRNQKLGIRYACRAVYAAIFEPESEATDDQP